MRSLLGALVSLVVGASLLPAQTSSRFSSSIPLWADSALTRAGFWHRYDLTSRTSPHVEFADLDGDGLWDVAMAVLDRSGRRRGIAVVHQIDRSIHVIGAGEAIVNGPDQLEAGATWGLGRLLGPRRGIRVVGRHGRAWIVWNGQAYAWVPDSQ